MKTVCRSSKHHGEPDIRTGNERWFDLMNNGDHAHIPGETATPAWLRYTIGKPNTDGPHFLIPALCPQLVTPSKRKQCDILKSPRIISPLKSIEFIKWPPARIAAEKLLTFRY
jgi:hypothetical protein